MNQKYIAADKAVKFPRFRTCENSHLHLMTTLLDQSSGPGLDRPLASTCPSSHFQCHAAATPRTDFSCMLRTFLVDTAEMVLLRLLCVPHVAYSLPLPWRTDCACHRGALVVQGEPGVPELRGLPGGAEAGQAQEHPAGAEGRARRRAAAAAADGAGADVPRLGQLLRLLHQHHRRDLLLGLPHADRFLRRSKDIHHCTSRKRVSVPGESAVKSTRSKAACTGCRGRSRICVAPKSSAVKQDLRRSGRMERRNQSVTPRVQSKIISCRCVTLASPVITGAQSANAGG